jgi:hypothetical protein
MSLSTSKPAEDICCDNEISNLDEGFKGKKVPASFGGGPRDPKKCTDILCCLIFVCFVGGIVAAAFLHYPTSKIGIMLTPRDSDGNMCGVSPKTKDYPYLYMVKFSSPYRSVCVKECLKFDFNQIRYNSTGANLTKISPVYYEDFAAAVKLHNTSWDNKTQSPNVTSVDDPNLFAYDPEAAQGYYTEGQFNNYVKHLNLECMTNSNVSSCAHNPSNKVFYYDSRSVMFNICFPLAPKLLKYSYFSGDLKTGYVADLKASWWIILVAVCSTVVIGILFLIIGSYFLPILLWVQIFLAVMLLLCLGILGIFMAIAYHNPSLQAGLESASAYSASVKSQYETLKNRIWILWVGSIVLIILAILIVVMVVKNYKGIKVALGVLKFSSVFMMKNILVVGVSIFAFMMQVVTFLLTVWALLIIHTSGDIESDGSGSPIPKFHYNFGKWCLWVAGIIVVYWTVVFWNNFADIVCGGATCNYYFGNTVGVFKTSIQCALYHSGSVAFASLILIPVTIVQICFGWFYAMATDDQPNAVQKCMTKVCCCTITPYQKWFNRVSEVGLTMTYFSSCNFCPSTKRNHYLNRRVGDSIGHVGFIGTLFKITGVLAIAGLNYMIYNWLITDTDYFKTRVQNPLVPLFAIFVFGVVVAALFMGIYSTSTDAALMCYLIELDLDKKPQHPELNEVIENKEKGGYKQL